MAERRVRVPKDKQDLIEKLTESAYGGPFMTKAHLMTFAAVYGFAKGTKVEFKDSLEPIRQEVFTRNGHDTIINLLALTTTKDPRILAQNDKADDNRISIFEEYANGGLERLRSELQGIDDPLEHLLLMLANQRNKDQTDDNFDLSALIRPE